MTNDDGALVNPDTVYSSTSDGNSAEVRFIACAMSYDTQLMVHSRVAKMFSHVSLARPVLAAIAGPIATIGGFEAKDIKKENGLRFIVPCASIDVTKAIGRGETPLRSNWCRSRCDRSSGRIVRICKFGH